MVPDISRPSQAASKCLPVHKYPGRFNFKGGDQQRSTVGNLSGGERGRWHSAKTLLHAVMFHIDEPSNDLDVETLVLEDALLEFAARRWIWRPLVLDRIAPSIPRFRGQLPSHFLGR